MKKMKYNTIPKQVKTATSRITPEEWNFIINVLKEQANHNSSILEDLSLLSKDLEKLSAEELDKLKEDIQVYLDEQITKRQAIIKVNQTPLTEVDLVNFMQTLEDGMYRIKTDLWGHEFLFVSDMNLPVDSDVEEPALELKKEYARYTSNGTSYRYDFELNDWVLSAGGGGGAGGGDRTYAGPDEPSSDFFTKWIKTTGDEADVEIEENFIETELEEVETEPVLDEIESGELEGDEIEIEPMLNEIESGELEGDEIITPPQFE